MCTCTSKEKEVHMQRVRKRESESGSESVVADGECESCFASCWYCIPWMLMFNLFTFEEIHSGMERGIISCVSHVYQPLTFHISISFMCAFSWVFVFDPYYKAWQSRWGLCVRVEICFFIIPFWYRKRRRKELRFRKGMEKCFNITTLNLACFTDSVWER